MAADVAGCGRGKRSRAHALKLTHNSDKICWPLARSFVWTAHTHTHTHRHRRQTIAAAAAERVRHLQRGRHGDLSFLFLIRSGPGMRRRSSSSLSSSAAASCVAGSRARSFNFVARRFTMHKICIQIYACTLGAHTHKLCVSRRVVSASFS